jgi:carbonyl reductase 1
MAAGPIALVTGANQGIGFALVEVLAARLDPDALVLLTGRNPERVAHAAALVAEAATTTSRVEGRVLDVSDATAVTGLAAELEERHGGVDIVVSNAVARMTPDLPQDVQADEFIDVANGGTSAMLRSFGPAMRAGGRMIVVASKLGTLGNLDPRLQPLLENASLDEVDEVVASWRAAMHAGTAQDLGWPRWVNVPSKVAQVAAVRAVARERRARDLAEDTLLAAVCPGLVDTETARLWFDVAQEQTPTQAATAILDWALMAPLDPATYGELVQFGKVLPWSAGTPRDPELPKSSSREHLAQYLAQYREAGAGP